jgi:hypothetical protein
MASSRSLGSQAVSGFRHDDSIMGMRSVLIMERNSATRNFAPSETLSEGYSPGSFSRGGSSRSAMVE